MIDYNDIKQTIAENLPDNNRREITAARLRDTLDGFVDKVQVTEAGLEGKVTSNETNIGNLSGEVSGLSGRVDTNEANVTNLTGRVDTNEANVTNLTGRVDSLSGEVSGLSGTVGNLSGEVSGLSGRVDDLSGSVGNIPRIVDNPIWGGTNDVASMKWDTTIAAIAGLYTAEVSVGGNALKVNKVSVIDGSYVKFDGTIVQHEGYSYFEYTLLHKDGYITVPAYNEEQSIVPDNNDLIHPEFYDKDGNVIKIPYDDILHLEFSKQFSGQREIKVPYGATMIRVPLINGTFDPDNVYVSESMQRSNCGQLYDLRGKLNNFKPSIDYLAKIGTDGNPVIDGSYYLSVIKLLAGDEPEAEIGYREGVQLAIGDSNNIESTKTVVYQEKPSNAGMIYYKADKTCYAFIFESLSYKVVRSDRFDRDIQYEMAALASKIRPVFGRVIKDSEGKGIFISTDSGVSSEGKIVFKVPVIAGTTLNYTLHYNSGLKNKGDEAYWYSGQPTASVDVNTQINFDSGNNKLIINNTASDKSGYALVTFSFESFVSEDELLNSVYLSKNAK